MSEKSKTTKSKTKKTEDAPKEPKKKTTKTTKKTTTKKAEEAPKSKTSSKKTTAKKTAAKEEKPKTTKKASTAKKTTAKKTTTKKSEAKEEKPKAAKKTTTKKSEAKEEKPKAAKKTTTKKTTTKKSEAKEEKPKATKKTTKAKPKKKKKAPKAKAKAKPKPKEPLTREAILKSREFRLAVLKRRRQPAFRHYQAHRWVRVKDSWRKVRGIDSATRQKRRGRIAMVAAGYRKPKLVRGIHPSGYVEVLVYRPADLEGLNPEIHAVRIARTVGARKRQDIITKAETMMLRVLNVGAPESVMEEDLFTELEGIDMEVG